MSGTILTPNDIWKNFSVPNDIFSEVIDEKRCGDIVLTHLYIQGQKSGEESVKIFATLAENVQQAFAPAVFVVEDFNNGFNEELVLDLANRGYIVLSVDIAGKKEGKEYYTVYPENISYADYENVKDKLFEVEETVNETAWYQWTASARWALKYLKNHSQVTKTGILGIGDSATVVWQIAGMDEVDCAVFALNSGWMGYNGMLKFGGKQDTQFSDSMYKFIAGVEPESYASHINCPTLVLSATNNKNYDCDRAYDTISRINDDIYAALYYSVNSGEVIDYSGYNDAVLFFENFLMKDKPDKDLTKDIDIKCEIADGMLVVEVSEPKAGMEKISLYVSEEIVDPVLRCWNKIDDYKIVDDKVIFKFSPYCRSGIAIMYAKVTFGNGFQIASKIIAKRFTPEEIKENYKTNIIYSSRIKNNEFIFRSENEFEKNGRLQLSESKSFSVKKGAMGMSGVTSDGGLLSFNIGAEKYHPNEDAILMLDIFTEETGILYVKLIAGYSGEKTEYIANIKITGSGVWNNVKIEKNKFKTVDGMPLKSYEKINAMAFSYEGKYLINNALWV